MREEGGGEREKKERYQRGKEMKEEEERRDDLTSKNGSQSCRQVHSTDKHDRCSLSRQVAI